MANYSSSTTRTQNKPKRERETRPVPPAFYEACLNTQQTLVCHTVFCRVYELAGSEDNPRRNVTYSFQSNGEWWKLRQTLWGQHAVENGGLLERFANEAWVPLIFDPNSVTNEPYKDQDQLQVRNAWVQIQGGPQMPVAGDLDYPFPPDYLEERAERGQQVSQQAGEEDSQIYDI